MSVAHFREIILFLIILLWISLEMVVVWYQDDRILLGMSLALQGNVPYSFTLSCARVPYCAPDILSIDLYVT